MKTALFERYLIEKRGGDTEPEFYSRLDADPVQTCLDLAFEYVLDECVSSALLVRGLDRYRHFRPEQRLLDAESAVAREAHATAYRYYMAATID